ncbi:hypothetical protein [Escherichia coli]|uniref:hypothetical protein n=1 Tax=Escherichia coli TaxID=562 RepID=UPI003AB9B67E
MLTCPCHLPILSPPAWPGRPPVLLGEHWVLPRSRLTGLFRSGVTRLLRAFRGGS